MTTSAGLACNGHSRCGGNRSISMPIAMRLEIAVAGLALCQL